MPVTKRRTAALLFVGLSGASAHAEAPADAPEATPAVAAPVPAEAAPVAPPVLAPTGGADVADRSDWDARYAAAKQLLLQGHFERARNEFVALDTAAPDPTARASARELASVADEWLRHDVQLTTKSAGAESTSNVDRTNRTTGEIAVLYLNAVGYGIGTGGWVAVHTEPKTIAGAVMPALLFAGASVGVVALLDAKDVLKYGVPQSIVSGLYIGVGEGLVWSLWNQARSDYSVQWRGSTVADVVWGSATVGAVGGGVLASVYGATPGTASYVGSAALWSGLVAGLAGDALGPHTDREDDTAFLSAAIGLNAGVLLGVATAGTVSPSVARVRFLDLGAIGGGLVAGGVYASAVGNGVARQALAGATAVGVAAGLGVSWALTSKMPKDHPAAETRVSAVPTLLGVTLAPAAGGATIAAYGLL